MNVRPGYKHTDIGVVPEDWETPPIIEAAPKIIDYRGRTPRKLGMDWGGGDIPALSARNVKMGFIDFDEECNLGSEALYKRWMTNGDAARSDIVFTTEAPLGNVALIPDDQRYILSQRTILLKTDSTRAYSPFLFQLMLSEGFQQLLAENASGSTAQGIQRKKFEMLRIACPPIAEQRAIAEALSDIDALLAALDRLIAKKRDLKQAAMQQLLTGQIRLPGFQGEWEVKRLGELGETYGGLTGKSKADFGTGKAKYVTFMNVMSNTVIDDSMFEPVCVSPAENQNRVERGDLLFNGSSETPEEVALCSLVVSAVASLFLNSFCFGFRLRDDAQAVGLFLTYYIRSSEGREIMKSLAQGSTRYNLSKKALLAAEVKLPTLSEQTAIATVISDMDAELTALEARRDKTRMLKQGMMQELLTGRTRLV